MKTESIRRSPAEELIDRESSIAVKRLSKKETKREGPEEGDLQTLFDGKIPEEKGKENFENGTVVTDVTLEKIRREAFQKAQQESDSYTFSQMISCFIENISQMSIMELGMLIVL